MKKIIALLAFAIGGISFAIAQAPEATTTPVSDQSVTPAVNAVEMSTPAAKCAAGTKSCCKSANKTSMATTTSTSSAETTSAAATTSTSAEPAGAPEATEQKAETTTEEGSTEKKCESVGFGMSAEKPQ